MKLLVFFIFILTNAMSFAQEDSVFNQGNNLYNDGKFQEAIAAYESILNEDKHSAELYFNLANAYYKNNQIAPSIYNYEKALQLAPNDKDISNNLTYAQNMTIDAIDTLPEVGLSRIIKNVINLFGVDGWAILSVTFTLAFILFFLSYYFAFHTNRKRFMFVSSMISIGLAIVTLGCAFQKYNYMQTDNPAIVFAQESVVKTDPNLRSENAFNLHEGTKVQVLESYGDHWSKIKISNGKTGWVSNEDIKLLKHF